MKLCLLLLLVVAAGCERAVPPSRVEPWEPFAVPNWAALPSDAQIVDAYVGHGGTDSERISFRALVASLLHEYVMEPDLEDSDMGRLESTRFQIKQSRRRFQEHRAFDGLTRAEAAYLALAEDAVINFHRKGWSLGAAELAKNLWPTEPYSPHRSYADASLAEVHQLATDLEAEFAAFRARVEPVIPKLFAKDVTAAPAPYRDLNYYVRTTYDSIAIATGRSYERSWGLMYHSLVEHGVPTTLTPEPPGYWGKE